MSETEALKTQIQQLASRVQELEDEREIRELLARYGYNADCCRDDEYVDLFTDDARFDLGSSMFGKVINQRWEGRKGIREFITDPTSHYKRGTTSGSSARRTAAG